MKRKKSSGRKDELECLRHQYEGRGKEAKPRMFEEFCEHYGYERKHAIKLFGGDQLPKPNGEARAEAQPAHEPVREVIETTWKASEQLCGKRLEPALELWLPHYGKHCGNLLPAQKKLLGEVSRSGMIGRRRRISD